MPLSKEDLTRLEEAGYCREEFAVSNKCGLVKLRNVNGWCYFYDPNMKRCKVYAIRPFGCYLYPIIYSDEEGVTVDKLCPLNGTISAIELERKGRSLMKHLKRIYGEYPR